MHSSTTIRVRFVELDPYSHVNHSIYVQYFEEARIDALSKVGQSVDKLLQQDVALVIAGIETKFVSPAHLGDELLIESGLSEIKRASATWLQRVSKGTSTVATQIARVGCTSLDGRPKRFPEELMLSAQQLKVEGNWLN